MMLCYTKQKLQLAVYLKGGIFKITLLNSRIPQVSTPSLQNLLVILNSIYCLLCFLDHS